MMKEGLIDVLMDGGAYCTLSPVVLSRGCLHATGPYRCDHVRVNGRVVMTNTPPNGAFRGFGAPQALHRNGANGHKGDCEAARQGCATAAMCCNTPEETHIPQQDQRPRQRDLCRSGGREPRLLGQR